MHDFFEQQNLGFRKSAKLFGLLSLAISGTVLLTSLAVTYVFAVGIQLFTDAEVSRHGLEFAELYAFVCFAVGVMIGASCWWKMLELRAGGSVIAADLGGVLLDETTATPEQKRALNVVHEMAVASSIPAPAVYVLDQPGINAFAAGFTFHDAVIGLTQGSIQRLSRDQLQGVVAHEFAHILNGDMRVNLRLVGGLHGILSVMLLAEAMLQNAGELWNQSDFEHAANDTGLAVVLCVLAIFIWPVGLIGTVFGMIVMGATSRTREFMADAMAVQLTRNAAGIADALKVIKGHGSGSRVRSKNSLEASHFFFAQGTAASDWLASHPPLDQRIQKLDPEWDGIPIFEEEEHLGEYTGAYQNSYSLLAENSVASVAAMAGVAAAGASPTSVDAAGERPQSEVADMPAEDAHSPFEDTDWTKRYASQLLSDLPETWIELVRDPRGCPAMMTCLWLSQLDDSESGKSHVSPVLLPAVESMLPHVLKLDLPHQVLLLDLALEAVDQVTPDEQANLQPSLRRISDVGPAESLTLWAWNRQLQSRFVPESRPNPKYGRLIEVQSACEVLLSWFCHTSANGEAMADYAFQRAVVHLQLSSPEIRARDSLTVELLDVALDMLAETSARCCRQIMIGVGCAVGADHVVDADEASLVRGTCAALRLDVPALIPGQPVAP